MSLLDQAKKGSTTDHTKTSSDFTYEIPPAGKTPARFIGYVEFGKQPQEYQGQEKKPALEAMLVWELNGKKHRRQVEVDGEEKEFTNRISVTLPVYTNSKAGFHKLFEAMRNGREEITHMAQMLNEPFLIDVVHNASDKDPKKVYANVKDAAGVWTVTEPRIQEFDEFGEVKGVRDIPVPAATQALMLLLWDNPTKEQWDSIFIEGEREVEKDGKKSKVSKNWMQQKCLSAIDFETSPLAQMIGGVEDAINDVLEDAKEEQKAPPKEEPPKEPKKEQPKPSDKDAKAADDVLAALGL